MRESWTDDRLDDLTDRVDAGFERVDRDFERVDRSFERVDDEFKAVRAEMKAGFDSLGDKIERRFDSPWRMMLMSYVSLVVPLFGLVVTFLLTRT